MTVYRSQREAITDARIGIWGDVPFAQREFVRPCPVVTARVNNRDVAIHFDHYGRLDCNGVVVLEAVTR